MPINPYNANPYYGSDVLNGSNTRGDSANGLYGSLTPSALANQQVNSQTQTSNNPYAEILNYIQPSQKTGTTRPVTANMDTENPGPGNEPPNTPPPSGPGGPEPTPPPATPPPAEPTPPRGHAVTNPAPPASTNPHPEWWSDRAWADAQQWGQNPGYEYLAQNPAYLDEYYQWVAGGAAANQDRSQVDVVDWLAHRGQNSPNAGRRGYDTFIVNADGTPTAWMDQTTMPNEQGGPNPTGITLPPGLKVIPTELPNQGQGGDGGSGSGAPVVPNPPIEPVTPTGPPSGTPPTTPPSPSPEVPPQTPPPGQQPPVTNPPVTGQGSGDIYALLQQLLAPEFGYESNQLSRAMAAQAALTGGLNSGGYLESAGRAQSQLTANQGQRMSDYLNTNNQNALNRALQYYGINTSANTAEKQIQMQGFIAKMQDDTSRFNIQTNADLQRYLDSQDNALKQYGIDKNDLLQRYQAELQLQGIKYSSDAGVQQAALNKASSQAMAHAQEAAEIARIQSQQAIQQQQLQNQYTQYQGNLAWQQYQYGHLSATDLLNAYLMFTPEQLAHMGLPPLTTVYGP